MKNRLSFALVRVAVLSVAAALPSGVDAVEELSELSQVLTVNKSGSGTGSVSSVPAAINCGVTCSSAFPDGHVVTLTATPSPGSIFSGFVGDLDCYDGTVQMVAARTCTAVFTLGPARGPTSPLYLMGESDRGMMISVLQGPTITNAWLAYSATHTPARDFERERTLAVTDVIKTFSRVPFQSVWYSLAGARLSVNPLTGPLYNTEQYELDGASAGAYNYLTTSFGNIFRFDSNWNNLSEGGRIEGRGIAHDPSNDSLWVSYYSSGGTVQLRQYSTGNVLLKSIALGGSGTADAVALDPADGTLWVNRYVSGGRALQQYSKQGALLASLKHPTMPGADSMEFARPPARPNDFYKIGPTSWASDTALALHLSWTPSAGATSYEYCIDTTNDNACSNWINVGTGTSVSPVNLVASAVYFWQVRALRADGTSYADGEPSRYWRFTTQIALPFAFGKTLPANGAPTTPLSLALAWNAAVSATSYEYCIDATDDNACSTSWQNAGNATSASVGVLPPNQVRYWQVRAVNANGTTYADGSAGAFFTFTTGVPAPAFGQVDSPSQNATGVQGAIGVTGWALDETNVAKVEIFRNCLALELGNCQMVLGNSVVYIGIATFVPGARPDIEAAFPTYPARQRAGWGYMMLTPTLPHVPNNQPAGGQGPITLYAIATDDAGNKTLLGRSSDPGDPSYATPTTITMANDTLAKPFGTIDRPVPGEILSGPVSSFGWALTPDSNTVGSQVGDILIPTNGSTMRVYIDGVQAGLVAYNQCRGNVGNPTPAVLYCNDDVANTFGNESPQAPLTFRWANPTKFRNLDPGRGAIGSFLVNASGQLAPGMHTIAWSVTDSLGRNEGIGSRFFNVFGTPDAPPSAPPLGRASRLSALAAETQGVWGRTGFDDAAPWIPMRVTDDETFAVRLPQTGRLELWLGDQVEAGYLVANETLQPLPIGTSLTGAQFSWMPPLGYAGPYRLAFVRNGSRIDVIVTVVETPRVLDDEAQIRMHLEPVVQHGRSVQIEGWAFDPQAAIGSGIAAVHVWAVPTDHAGAPAHFMGAAALDPASPGFSLTATLKPGRYTVTAYAWNERTARWEDARSVTTVVK